MAVNLTIARVTNGQLLAGTQIPGPGGTFRELVRVTGAASSANDTSAAYTPQGVGYGFAPIGIVGGNFKATISGRTIALLDINGIGSQDVLCEILFAVTGS